MNDCCNDIEFFCKSDLSNDNDFLWCSKNARYWHKLKPPRFPLPQTPFKTVGVVERFWACIEVGRGVLFFSIITDPIAGHSYPGGRITDQGAAWPCSS
jgi:hypothetical protein